MQHPNDLELELTRFAGEGDPAVATHLQGCASCRERLALMSQLSSALNPSDIAVPAKLDAKLRADARRAGQRVAAPRKRLWQIAVGSVAAAAAAVLIALSSGLYSGRVTTQPSDINGDGRVDITDALALARGVAQTRTEAAWDFNGDRRVDDGDVEVVALAAVSLGKARP